MSAIISRPNTLLACFGPVVFKLWKEVTQALSESHRRGNRDRGRSLPDHPPPSYSAISVGGGEVSDFGNPLPHSVFLVNGSQVSWLAFAAGVRKFGNHQGPVWVRSFPVRIMSLLFLARGVHSRPCADCRRGRWSSNLGWINLGECWSVHSTPTRAHPLSGDEVRSLLWVRTTALPL